MIHQTIAILTLLIFHLTFISTESVVCNEQQIDSNENQQGIQHDTSNQNLTSEYEFVDRRKAFLESRNQRRMTVYSSNLTDEEFDEIVYGKYDDDLFLLDWEREIKLLNWRRNPSLLNHFLQEKRSHPFDKTRRCLIRMLHKENLLKSNDCLIVNSTLLRFRNEKMSMRDLTLNQWEYYDSRKSKTEVIREVKSARNEPNFKHSIMIELHSDAIESTSLSMCEKYLYWISYEVQHAYCILITPTCILFEFRSENVRHDEKHLLDYLSRFVEVQEIFWRGFSSNETPDKINKGEIEYTDEQHYLISIFHHREKNQF